MTQAILMPTLSPTMTKGTLARWLIAPGDKVNDGDVIAEVETDKVTIEIEAQQQGYVAELKYQDGDEDIPVDAVIAMLSETPVKAAVENHPATDKSVTPIQSKEAPQIAMPTPTPSQPSEVDASPLAKRMAQIAQVDLAQINGSGAKGRIVKRDIEKAMGVQEAVAKAKSSQAIIPTNTIVDTSQLPPHQDVKLSSMRSVIASRLTESSRDVPHFYMTVDCQIDALLAIRKTLNEQLTDGKITVNDMLVKAVAAAFALVPEANILWAGDRLMQFEQADIAIAVAIDQGLITPVIRNATNRGLHSIAKQSKEMVTKARAGKLSPEQYQGGTFTISNLGMYGIKEFTSIINPPHNGILSVGVGEQRPVVKDGELIIATVMSLTLAMDHRAVDGATGAKLLQTLKDVIEQPYKLML